MLGLVTGTKEFDAWLDWLLGLNPDGLDTKLD